MKAVILDIWNFLFGAAGDSAHSIVRMESENLLIERLFENQPIRNKSVNVHRDSLARIPFLIG